MRNVYWLVAASLVASASVVYVAADYASRHPSSLLGRCVTAAIAPATVCESSCLMACPGQRPKEDKAASTPAPSGNSQPKLTLEPVAEECPDTPLTPPAPEASEPIQVNLPAMPAVVPQADSNPAYDGTEAAKSPECSKGTGPEECEVVPPSMPTPAVCQHEVPSFMPPWPEGENHQTTAEHNPYVAEDAEMKEDAGCPLGAWFYWLKKMAGSKGTDKKDQTQQESDLTPEASNSTTTYPGGTEASDPSQPPNCQEDPDYHHQYPGCPHVGGCGAPGQCCPLPAPAVTPKVKHKKKKVPAKPVSTSPKGKSSSQTSGEEEECTHTSGVDTMECRPSDVNMDDMDPNTPH